MNLRIPPLLLALLASVQAKSGNPLDTWTVVHSEKSGRRLFGVTYSGERFVAVGEKVLSSTDARTWTESRMPIDSRSGLALNSIAYGAGRFVAVQWHPYWGSSGMFSSGDGVTWTQSWAASGLPYFRDIIFAEGRFVAVGVDATAENDNLGAVLTSSDGLAWSQHRPATQRHMSAIAHGNGRFVALGYGYYYNSASGTARYTKALMTSSNGIDWVQHSPEVFGGGSDFTEFQLAFGSGQFVTAANSYDSGRLHRNCIYSSIDGVSWVQRRVETAEYRVQEIAFGAGLLAIVSGTGPILASRDGINWTQHKTNTDDWLGAITYGDGRFVAVGENGSILESGGIAELAPRQKPGIDGFTLTLSGRRGERYVIQASLDLLSWNDIASATLGPTGTVQFEALAPTVNQRFYRALQSGLAAGGK